VHDSLAKTLEHFPVLKSRLYKTHENGFAFSVTDNGLDFSVRESKEPFQTNGSIEDYITPVRTQENEPLTRVVLTNTSDGCVLAVSISHALVDGFSFFHFMSCWARITRGERFLSPHIPRDIFTQYIQQVENEITPKSIYEQCGLFYGERRGAQPAKSLIPEREFIQHDTIKKYIEEIKQTHNTPVSENDVVTAHLWKKYLPEWTKESSDEKVYITCPFDFRRVLSGFPKNYFGCALSFATAETTRDHLINASIGDIAVLIKKSVSAVKEEYIRRSLSVLDTFRRQKGTGEMDRIHLRHPQRGMIVTNVSRLPLGDLDLGSGRPDNYLTYAEIGQSAAILPANDGLETYVVFFP